MKDKHLTPAQRHKQRIEAMEAAKDRAANGEQGHGAVLSDASSQLNALFLEVSRKLSSIQSEEAKAVFKREQLPHFEGYIDGVLEADTGTQDDLFATLMIWHIDAGFYSYALSMAAYMLKHQLKMPAPWTRSVAAVVADNMATQAAKMGGEAPAILLKTIEVVTGYDMPDQAMANLLKARAFATIQRTSSGVFDASDLSLDAIKQALQELERATALMPKVGAVIEVRALQKLIKVREDEQAELLADTTKDEGSAEGQQEETEQP